MKCLLHIHIYTPIKISSETSSVCVHVTASTFMQYINMWINGIHIDHYRVVNYVIVLPSTLHYDTFMMPFHKFG